MNLRRFNLEDIKAGATLIESSDGRNYLGTVKYLAGPDTADDIAFEDEAGYLRIKDVAYFYIKPVGYLDGKPVYPGDNLWFSFKSKSYLAVVKYFQGTALKLEHIEENCSIDALIDISYTPFVDFLKNCSWEKPKAKKEGWINLYKEDATCYCPAFHLTRETADKKADIGRLACVKIEWEE